MFGTAKKSDNAKKNRVGYAAFLGANYGSVLQALALYTSVNRLGYECEILSSDYFTQAPKPGRVLKAGKPKRYDYRMMRWLFANFIRRNFRLSKTLGHITAPLNDRQKQDMNRFDAFICGSDQIWNPSSFWFVPTNYLEFAPKGKRIAYAPSVGMKNIPEKFHQNLRLWFERLREIDFLSSREKASSRMIERITGRKVATVLDPTLLVTPEEWLKLLDKPVWSKEIGAIVKSGKKYVLAYLLDLEPVYKNKIADFAASKGLEVAWLAGRDDCGPLTINCSQTDPSGFVHLLARAEYVFVDGYHGTCFSINFGRPFAVLRATREEKQNLDMRIANLFAMLGIASFGAHEDPGTASCRFESVGIRASGQKETTTDVAGYDGSYALCPEDEITETSFFRDYKNIASALSAARRESFDYLADSLKAASESDSRKLPPAYELGYSLSSERSDPWQESGIVDEHAVRAEDISRKSQTETSATDSASADMNDNLKHKQKEASKSATATSFRSIPEEFELEDGFAEFPRQERAVGQSAETVGAGTGTLNGGNSSQTGEQNGNRAECSDGKTNGNIGATGMVYSFSFEPEVWNIEAGDARCIAAPEAVCDRAGPANFSTILKTRKATPGKGHFAYIRSPLQLQRNRVYTVNLVFRYRTASGLINFHLYNPDLRKVQIVHGYRTEKPTKEKSPAREWKSLKFSFIPNSSGYSSLMVGAYHLSGKEAFIEFGRLSIKAAT